MANNRRAVGLVVVGSLGDKLFVQRFPIYNWRPFPRVAV